MNDIGQRLRNLRYVLKLSQVELASQLGITKQAVSNMETGKSLPAISTLSKLLLEFNVNINYLISGVGNILIEDKNKVGADLQSDFYSFNVIRESILTDVKELLHSKGIY